jgi:hypothetical protein
LAAGRPDVDATDRAQQRARRSSRWLDLVLTLLWVKRAALAAALGTLAPAALSRKR